MVEGGPAFRPEVALKVKNLVLEEIAEGIGSPYFHSHALPAVGDVRAPFTTCTVLNSSPTATIALPMAQEAARDPSASVHADDGLGPRGDWSAPLYTWTDLPESYGPGSWGHLKDASVTARVRLYAHIFATRCVEGSGPELEPVSAVIRKILASGRYDSKSLAAELRTTQTTISRWRDGKAVPRASGEGRIREIYQEVVHSEKSQPRLTAWVDAHRAVSETLAELREILHRRGRLASRNEALEELAKLLFAHVMGIGDGGGGIRRASVLGTRHDNAAAALRRFVEDVFKQHLPISLSHEVGLKDFELRLKDQENVLAIEIIDCFERLAPKAQAESSDLGGLDFLNEAFGTFLADSFVDEKQLGQYLTPREVVKFMVQLAIEEMTPEERDSLQRPGGWSDFGLILDPSCGVGSFLAEFLCTFDSGVVGKHGHEKATDWLRSMIERGVIGIDKSERMVRLALTNMAMFGFSAANLHCVNALARTGEEAAVTRDLEGKVGLILTNPPFGAEFPAAELRTFQIAGAWASRPPHAVDSELLFLERYVDWLRPGGQLVAIVPDSILTNKGLFEDLRSHLSHEVEICSVTSLPPVTFEAAGTATKTSILQLRKRGPRKSKSRGTFFSICTDVGYSVSTRDTHRTKVFNGGGELPRILKEYVSPDAPSFGKWVAGVESAHRWDANFHASLPEEIARRLANPREADVRISDVAELSIERADPRRWGAKAFNYIEISDVDPESLMVRMKPVPSREAPSRARRLVRAGDVLVSTVRPERKAIGVVLGHQDKAVCSTGFAVLRPRRIDPVAFAALLKTDFVTAQIMRNNIGIAYPAIDENCLPDILLPVAEGDIPQIDEKARAVAETERRAQEVRKELRLTIQSAVERWLAG